MPDNFKIEKIDPMRVAWCSTLMPNGTIATTWWRDGKEIATEITTPGQVLDLNRVPRAPKQMI